MRVLFLSFSWGFQDFFAGSLGLSGPEILISSLNWEGLVHDGISPKVYEFEKCRKRTRWFMYIYIYICFFSPLVGSWVFSFSHCFLGVKNVTSFWGLGGGCRAPSRVTVLQVYHCFRKGVAAFSTQMLEWNTCGLMLVFRFLRSKSPEISSWNESESECFPWKRTWHWKITMFKRWYIDSNGCFSIVILLFEGV